MKIMVTARGDNLDAQMDERYGRAEYFIIYDTDSDSFEAIKNPYINDRGGVGISVAKFTIEKGVDVVISGSFGPNAQDVLKDTGIKLYSAKNATVKEIIEAFKDGKLEEFSGEEK